MTHSTLDTEITVDPISVPHHQNAGWEVVPGQDETGDEWPAELQRFEGQQQVRMHHPDIADDIIVAASAVPFHRSKGWLISDPDVADQLEGAGGLGTDKAERTALEAKTVAELQDIARRVGLKVSGTKEELVERLTKAAPGPSDRAEVDQDQDQAGDEPAQDREE
jgi:hypothetical protein